MYYLFEPCVNLCSTNLWVQAAVSDLNEKLLLVGIFAAWKTAFHYAIENCSKSENSFYSLIPDLPENGDTVIHKLCIKARSLRLNIHVTYSTAISTAQAFRQAFKLRVPEHIHLYCRRMRTRFLKT